MGAKLGGGSYHLLKARDFVIQGGELLRGKDPLENVHSNDDHQHELKNTKLYGGTD